MSWTAYGTCPPICDALVQCIRTVPYWPLDNFCQSVVLCYEVLINGRISGGIVWHEYCTMESFEVGIML